MGTIVFLLSCAVVFLFFRVHMLAREVKRRRFHYSEMSEWTPYSMFTRDVPCGKETYEDQGGSNE